MSSAGGRGSPSPGLRRGTVALVVVHVVLGLLVYESILLANGDNAGYMILGEALRTGEGYRDLHLPGSPVHVKFPPLYPAMLAVLGWVGGVQLFKLASLSLTAVAVGLTTRLGHRWLGLGGGLLAGGLVAANPLLLEYGHHVMSEALFTALMMLSLYAADRSRDEAAPDGSEAGAGPAPVAEGAGRWWWLGVVAAAAAFLTRSVGVALLAGITLAPLLRGRMRRFTSAAVVLAAVAGSWMLFQRLAAPGRAGYLAEWLMVHPYDPSAGTIGLAGMIDRMVVNLWTYVSWFFPGAMAGLAEGYAGGGRLVAVLGVGLSALALLGWLVRSRPRPGAAEVTVFFYVVILASWPSLWVDRRFLVPVIPLLGLYLVTGAASVGRRASGLLQGVAGAPKPGEQPGRGVAPTLRGAALMAASALTIGLALPIGADLVGRVPERVDCMLQYRRGEPCQQPAFHSFFEAARWAGSNSGPQDVFVSAKPRFFYLESGRKSRIYRYTEDPQQVLRELRESRADYVVVDALPGIGNTTRRYLIPAVQADPASFAVVYEGGDPSTTILRITAGESPPEGS